MLLNSIVTTPMIPAETLWPALHPSSLLVPAAAAADYESLTPQQKLVAEAWRLVDNSFYDRSFHQLDWFKVRQDYIQRNYQSMEQAQAAVAEMVSLLGDKYTRYLPPAKYQSLVDSATGTLATAGIGTEISVNADHRIIVSDVEPNSPAQRGGIQPNDVFLQVDGTKFDQPDNTPDDVAMKLRGPEGSKVGVVLQRGSNIVDVILTREPITINTVRSYATSVNGVGKVGVIRIKSFSGTTADLVEQELSALKRKGNLNGIVIDIRGNPGGLLPGGVNTASLFLPENSPVVFVVNKNQQVDSQYTLSTGIDLETPLVVLVDSGTASAAEVFTAALQENHRATIVGGQTFGKGIIQTIRSLSNGEQGGVAITVARYETPQHHDINQRGIPVDVATSVDCPKTDAALCLKGANANAFKLPKLS
jgi:carboxyl-terminal processing protease